GERMSDYPIDGGVFMQACEKLLTQDFHISWFDRFPAKHVTAQALESAGDAEDGEGADLGVTEESQTKPTRAKYTCPKCETNVWGKPALKLVCGECGSPYEVNESP
ncbi:MAG: sprT domain-containing protein, partial [Burkholderia gladioli]